MRRYSGVVKSAAKIMAAALIFSVMVFSAPGVMAAAPEILYVYADIDSEKTLVAHFTLKELEDMSLTKCYYSTIDASASPMTVAAQGITISDFLSTLAIPENDVTGVDFSSMDGWKRSFPAEDYLNTELYYYPQIISGYDRAAINRRCTCRKQRRKKRRCLRCWPSKTMKGASRRRRPM